MKKASVLIEMVLHEELSAPNEYFVYIRNLLKSLYGYNKLLINPFYCVNKLPNTVKGL